MPTGNIATARSGSKAPETKLHIVAMKSTFLIIKFCLALICFTGLKNLSAGQIFVKITETDNTYELKTIYDPAKSKQVTAYMDKSITGYNDLSFKNAQLDADITLDSKITFYVKSHPGELVLKFDKRKNNTSDYAKFKKMCEGIKAIIEKN